MEKKALELLKSHDLRVTAGRLEILKLFMGQRYALSQPDVERMLGEFFDRVTIYRTLTSFLEKGVIHKVLDDSSVAKYALCQSHCESHAHADEHIHFKCTHCGNTSCLDGLPFPHFHAPAGYSFSETSVLIHGVCPACRQAKPALA